MPDQFDITIIGSGPGGYVAAIRAAQLGHRTALVEKYSKPGGTCTNVGCIPSKALLDSTEHYHNALTKFQKHGIGLEDLSLNFQQLMHRKDEVVKQNTAGIRYLLQKNKIEVFEGTGSFVNKEEVIVRKSEGSQTIRSKFFIIATGSKPATLPGLNIDKKRIITSTEALSLKEKPGSMVIIGGGVIGVEMASIFARTGTEVTILEYAESLIPAMDRELGKELKKILTKLNIKIQLKAKVQEAKNEDGKVTIKYQDAKENPQVISAGYCLVAVGRKPYTEGLALDKAGVETDNRGFIKVNNQLRTNIPNIYAVGDVTGGAMLAHKAEEEGVFTAEVIHGLKPHPLEYHLIPGVVYTWPEVASTGFTEEQLKEKGIAYRCGKFPFSALGRARAAMDTEGFVKVLTEPKYGEILGVHIIGARAADLIGQAVVGMAYEVTDEDMFRISYAHPTYSEALKEAYLIASGQGALNL